MSKRVAMQLDFSATGRLRVWLVTLAGMIFCAGAALFVDSFNFPTMTADEFRRAIAVDLLLPSALAGPLLFLLMSKIRQLAIAQRDLAKLASTDSLTAVLNRGAFTMMVDAYLEQSRAHANLRSGALLVIDADHFKNINDRFGHQLGDEALKLIAGTIKGMLRGADIVGRVGGEEFGVFLPGATPEEARTVAERIRQAVGSLKLPLPAISDEITVSIGGVTYNGLATYDHLFSLADERLYGAKATGRNRVLFRHFTDPPLAA
ncbi:GGDEF domain-containing protein [Devosia sp. 1566]|uniref:GGDEF domain-containing protein n=1 Tax=Devosia sp. 1566 TaxID=2499144 RepID=UPI0020BFAAC6|nr:GGDEF domain-containing protein [Devosia sp. 1566]